jgi:hypothetical protein
MKKQILELAAKIHTEEEFELQSEFLRLLLNPTVTDFTFPLGLVQKDNKAAGSALCENLIAEQPHAMHTLVTESPNIYERRDWNFSDYVKTFLRSFPNLDTLVVQGLDFLNVHFKLIGQNLHNLR